MSSLHAASSSSPASSPSSGTPGPRTPGGRWRPELSPSDAPGAAPPSGDPGPQERVRGHSPRGTQGRLVQGVPGSTQPHLPGHPARKPPALSAHSPLLPPAPSLPSAQKAHESHTRSGRDEDFTDTARRPPTAKPTLAMSPRAVQHATTGGAASGLPGHRDVPSHRSAAGLSPCKGPGCGCSAPPGSRGAPRRCWGTGRRGSGNCKTEFPRTPSGPGGAGGNWGANLRGETAQGST